jgi:hypothetical protein
LRPESTSRPLAKVTPGEAQIPSKKPARVREDRWLMERPLDQNALWLDESRLGLNPFFSSRLSAPRRTRLPVTNRKNKYFLNHIHNLRSNSLSSEPRFRRRACYIPCPVKVRSIRRTGNPQTSSPDLSTAHSLSEAQLAANRANAQLSTGPRTEIGKRLSSVNAVKTGLTGHRASLLRPYRQPMGSIF